MNAIDRFDEAAASNGAATAIAWDSLGRHATVSFAALADRSRRLATLFTRAGLARGDAVAVLLPFGPAMLAVTGALLRCGLTAVFADPVQWRATLASAASALPLRGMVGTPKLCALRWLVPVLRPLHPVFADGHCPGAQPLAGADAMPPQQRPVACHADDLGLVTFTSGTTGTPKAVARTHGVLAAMQGMLEHEIGLVPGEVHLSTLPFAALAELGAGATCVIPAVRHGRPDAARIADQVRTHHVQVIVAAPGTAEELAGHAAPPFVSVRRVYLGGAPVHPGLLDRWRHAAPAAEIHVVYGMTEAEPIATLAGRDYGDDECAATRAGGGLLVGHPAAGAHVRIASLADATRFLPPGSEGEIVVSGPQVAPAYLGHADDAATAIVRDGRRWLRTGDAGYFDSRGRLWLTGRRRDGVDAGGTILHPLRVEAALADDPAVARSAFLCAGDERILVVEPREPDLPLPLARIAAAVAFAAPRSIAVMRHIPLDARHRAKTDYRRLATAIAAGEAMARHPLAPFLADRRLDATLPGTAPAR